MVLGKCLVDGTVAALSSPNPTKYCLNAQTMVVCGMDIRNLEYVLAIEAAGSIGRAASRIGLTQQALSKSLSRFEANCGGKLFERTTRGMVLTRLGRTVCEHARDIIESTGRLKSAINSELDIERGRLVVGLSPIAATGDAGRVLTKFAAQYPALRIDIEGGIENDFSHALSIGKIDLAVATHMGGMAEGLLNETIGEEKWGVAGRTNHSKLSRAKSLRDLSDALWLIGRNTGLLDEAIDQSFREAEQSVPRPGIMTTSVLYALSALPHIDHLAILPKSLCSNAPGIRWKDLSDGQWTTPVYLMRRRRAHMSGFAAQLVSQLTVRA